MSVLLAQESSHAATIAGSNLEYANQTVLHPLGLLAVLVLGTTMLLVPRRWAILPMIVMACFVASAQRIAIMTIDFNLLRIMVLFGVARLYFRKEMRGFVWKSLDTVVVSWTLSMIIIFSVQQGTVSAFINRLGFGFDSFGMYFLFRCLIRTWRDVDHLILGCILISIPVSVFFLLENRTGHNLFSIFGGVPALTEIRDGRLRCQGAFSHEIIAGCFWASLVPLFAVQWWRSLRGKIWAVTGLLTSSIIIICCASSTPVMGVLSAMLAAFFFLFRYNMRLVRWAVVGVLVALQIVMESPVWHLISRVSAVGGSTGWHRYHLIDEAVNRVGEWFLFGTPSTAHWGLGLEDVTNQYVMEAVSGGFATLFLFCVLIAVSFREVGRLWRAQQNHPYLLAMSWALGVSLFVHCVNFIGVSYFGQIWILWYLVLALIGSMSIKRETAVVSKQYIANKQIMSTSRSVKVFHSNE